MSRHFDDTPFAQALLSCILCAWWGMLRKSNVTDDEVTCSPSSHCLTGGDITVDSSRYMLRVRVGSTKNNQFKERRVEVLLHGHQGHPLDPVAAWERHVRSSELPPTAQAFAFMEAGVAHPLRYGTLRSALKLLFQSLGGAPSAVSSHSLRRGGATFAWHSGVQEILLQAHGDWQSMCYRDYIDASQEARLTATKRMFQRIVEGTPTVMFPALAPVEHVVPEPAQHFQPVSAQQQPPVESTYETKEPDQAEAGEPMLVESFTELLHSHEEVDMVIL